MNKSNCAELIVEIVVQMTLFVSLEREIRKRYYLQLHFYKYSLVVKNLNLRQVVNIDGQPKLTYSLKNVADMVQQNKIDNQI